MRVDSHVHLQPHGEQPPVDRARVEAYVEAAKRNGVDAVVFTEHLFRFREAYDQLAGWWEADPDPVLAETTAAYWRDHVNLSLAEYVHVIERAKADGLPVYLGLELDWIPGKAEILRSLLAPYNWDVVLGSVHWIGAFGFDNPEFLFEWRRRTPDSVFADYTVLLSDLGRSRMVDVLAHPDLPKLFGHRPISLAGLYDAIVRAAQMGGCALEINTNGLRQRAAEIYPAEEVLQRACAAGIPITLASDAHSPERVGQAFNLARRTAENAGYNEFSMFISRRPQAYPL
jgi:histidinol-phosphatase (PHP family)